MNAGRASYGNHPKHHACNRRAERPAIGIPYLYELIGQEIQVPPGRSGGKALIELLIASLAGFTGSGEEPEDDVTLVMLDYLGPGWPVEDPAQTKIVRAVRERHVVEADVERACRNRGAGSIDDPGRGGGQLLDALNARARHL